MPHLSNVSDWRTPRRAPVRHPDFDLAATLECGQAFRWSRDGDGRYIGVVGKAVWRLRQDGETIEWETDPKPTPSPSKEGNSGSSQIHITRYLSLDRSLPQIIATFPGNDEALHAAARKHRGLRVLRQEPWECLASFMASSTKQIVQIRQIVELLARRFGEPIDDAHFAFPAVEAVARATHQQLWDCKLGFRAKNLLAAARLIDSGKLDWTKVTVGAASRPRFTGPVAPTVESGLLLRCDYETALAELTKLPGVGEKIANCTLLFACGFDEAFPIDVWIERALRRIYFGGGKRVTARHLREFARSHFGPYAGWAQQYLFFNERLLGQHRPRSREPLLDVGAQ